MSRNVTDLSKLRFDKNTNQWLLVNKPIQQIQALTMVMTALGLSDPTEGLKELEKIKERKEEKKPSPDDIYRDLAHRFRIFDKFRIIRVGEGEEGSTVVYLVKDNVHIPVCSLEAFDSSVVDTQFQISFPEDWDSIVGTAQMMLNPFETYRISSDDVFDGIFNVLRPARCIERIVLPEDPAPCAIEGAKVFTLRRIPYTPTAGNLEETHSQLNYHLREFLSRVEHHEYVCAYLWRLFNGKHNTELIYLKGHGGDGKTSFVEMVGKITKSMCSLGTEKYEVFAMYGKSIINIGENRNPHLMSTTLIKTITGRNLQKLEPKYKGVFFGKLQGTIIVDSNHELAINGTPDEVRRLRYFRVDRPNITASQKIDPLEYVELLGSTPNVFLNYCRLCFEALATDRGLVPPPPNHVAAMCGLMDKKAKYKYGKVFDKVQSKGYVLDKDSFVEADEIVGIICEIYPDDKNPYTIQEFNQFMHGNYGVEFKDGKYYGIRKQTTQEKKSLFKSIKGIKDAMPDEDEEAI